MHREVRELRDKIAKKQAGLQTYLKNGTFQPRSQYLQGLKSQEATFEYVLNELDKVLASTATSEPIR